MDRRNFLKNSVYSFGGLTILQSLPFLSLDKLYNEIETKNNQKKIFPDALKAGSTIAIASPASPTSMYEIRHSLNFFRSLGLKVIIGESVKNQRNRHRYLAAPDNERADEFMSYIRNPEIDAIIAARGGYGVLRILDMIDFDDIKKNPKIIIGFSDITALLNAIYQETGLITFHGPVASIDFSYITKQSFRSQFFDEDDEAKSTFNNMIVINKGEATGEICGGNLTMINSLLGTKYEIDTKGKILLIEEISEHAYQVDRLLNQLKIAGKLHQASAIVFGKFKNLNVRKPFFPNRGYTIMEVINQIVKPLGIPTVIGLPFGHTSDKLTIPIGTGAKLNAGKKSFKLLEKGINF